MPKFLPREAAGEQYGITRQADLEFASEESGFITEVAKKMHVEAVRDVGRVPSLFSRVYTFYTDLFPEELGNGAAAREGRREAREQARRAFRGIACVLALRHTLRLDVRVESFSPQAQAGNPFRVIFANAYETAPGFPDVPAWKPFRYLVIGQGADTEPLCGLSPFTLFFPSRKRLAGSRRIFWYDYDAGRSVGEWYDPTTDWCDVQKSGGGKSDGKTRVLRKLMPEEQARGGTFRSPVMLDVIKVLRRQMHGWLSEILQGGPQAAWRAFGLSIHCAEQLQGELMAWRDELAELEKADFKTGANRSTGKESLGLNAQDQNGNPTPVPLLEETVGDERGELISELPRLPNGRILLSKDLLQNPEIRVCGGVMGRPGLERCLANMPEMGDQFTILDGSYEHRIPERYVVVDKLFLEKIHCAATRAPAENFLLLTPGSGMGVFYLLPFKPGMLDLLDLGKLLSEEAGVSKQHVDCRVEKRAGDNCVVVELKIAGEPFTEVYPPEKQTFDLNVQDTLDVRIWPDFYFSTEPKIPELDGDRVHYIRVRQSPKWGAEDSGLEAQVVGKGPDGQLELHQPESGPQATGFDGNFERCRKGKFYAFPSRGTMILPKAGAGGAVRSQVESKPVGIYFVGRGFLFFQLEEPAQHGGDWRLAVDFGTSNTCAARLLLGSSVDAKLKVMQFETLTTAMQRAFRWSPIGKDSEGVSSLLDFPYTAHVGEDRTLFEGDYFPSQVVTRREAGLDDTSLKFSNGLIFFRNVGLDSEGFPELIRGFPALRRAGDGGGGTKPGIGGAKPKDTGGAKKEFMLKTDIKWSNRAYRKVFLWHMYKVLVLQAAKEGAVIREAAFSYPRAFDQGAIESFRVSLRSVFTGYGRIRIEENDLVSESEAVQRWLVCQRDGKSHCSLDVGGGTTDYLIVTGNEPVYQASHVFAGSFVNRYFEASPLFRELFREAVTKFAKEGGGNEAGLKRDLAIINQERLTDLVECLKEGQGGDDHSRFCDQAFFGLLGLLTTDLQCSEVLHYLADTERNYNEEKKRSICGFFYTLVLLYGGMAYAAGKLLRASEKQVRVLKFDLIGNGARFYQFLDGDGKTFASVMGNLFRKGYGQQEMHVEDTAVVIDGKARVAKGLLYRKQDGGGSVELGGGGQFTAAYTPAPVCREQDSYEYFLNWKPGRANLSPAERFIELKEFLGMLQREVPEGKVQGRPRIPYCRRDVAEELGAMLPEMVQALEEAEEENAKKVKAMAALVQQNQQAGNAEEAQRYQQAADAVEPRFITQLKVLLRCVRKKYAPAPNTALFEPMDRLG